MPLVALVGAMIKKPGDQLVHTLFGPATRKYPATGVPIVYSDWRRVSPDDIEPGGIATVFPGVRPRSVRHERRHRRRRRRCSSGLRPGQTVKARKGQAGFGWPAEPEYVAFSKICTHAGCPASLYEQQTTRLLCPCHQSQFEVLQDAKPVFGPATRSLPKLPLGVEVGRTARQYFVRRHDYHEPIGPGFWERP